MDICIFEYVIDLNFNVNIPHKGGDDLRQDEGVMQIFGLVNNLFARSSVTLRKNLAIQLFNVLPLSESCGLLQWLHNCDTIDHLINTHRIKKGVRISLEEDMIIELTPTFACNQKINITEMIYITLMKLNVIQKLNVFESVIENTPGNDLAEILWHKSSNAEQWLERRTNFSRSLAVMSIVGYVLGLGDRHTNNLMFERTNGKIIHIDFGDCFEHAMIRDNFPEKIPFRLTRMFINAMEVTGIEGIQIDIYLG